MSRKVYIDAGHGGSDPGALGVNSLKEKDITVSVTNILKELLLKQGVDVLLTREEDSTHTLNSRTNKANEWNADCLVSIHCNAFNGSAQGIETYCYSLNRYRDLADEVHNSIISNNVYTKDRGVKEANFHMLRESNMRACLVELAFIDNIEDSKLLTDMQYQFAEAITKGICKYLGIVYQEPSNVDVYYRVVCGSYQDKNNALLQQKQLHDAGFSSFLVAYKPD